MKSAAGNNECALLTRLPYQLSTAHNLLHKGVWLYLAADNNYDYGGLLTSCMHIIRAGVVYMCNYIHVHRENKLCVHVCVV